MAFEKKLEDLLANVALHLTKSNEYLEKVSRAIQLEQLEKVPASTYFKTLFIPPTLVDSAVISSRPSSRDSIVIISTEHLLISNVSFNVSQMSSYVSSMSGANATLDLGVFYLPPNTTLTVKGNGHIYASCLSTDSATARVSVVEAYYQSPLPSTNTVLTAYHEIRNSDLR